MERRTVLGLTTRKTSTFDDRGAIEIVEHMFDNLTPEEFEEILKRSSPKAYRAAANRRAKSKVRTIAREPSA